VVVDGLQRSLGTLRIEIAYRSKHVTEQPPFLEVPFLLNFVELPISAHLSPFRSIFWSHSDIFVMSDDSSLLWQLHEFTPHICTRNGLAVLTWDYNYRQSSKLNKK